MSLSPRLVVGCFSARTKRIAYFDLMEVGIADVFLRAGGGGVLRVMLATGVEEHLDLRILDEDLEVLRAMSNTLRARLEFSP